jgi:hypothetical protein
LFVGPASFTVLVQMKVSCSVRANVVRVGPMEVAARQLFLIERDEDSEAHRFARQRVLFGGRSVAPDHAIRLRELNALFDPREEMGIPGKGSADAGRER